MVPESHTTIVESKYGEMEMWKPFGFSTKYNSTLKIHIVHNNYRHIHIDFMLIHIHFAQHIYKASFS